MKTASAMVALFALLLIGCTNKTVDDHGHEHEAGGLEPLSYTIYSDKTELFVEFKPLVVGSISNFAAHFTILGERFLPLTEGSVTVSLIVGETGLRNHSDSASSPGIFRLALIPKTAGTGRLVFDIETKDYTDQIVIDDVQVYPDEQTAMAQQSETAVEGEVSFLKEQAWRVEFANFPAVKQSFSEVIKTNGQILSAPGDERMVTASASGIVSFTGNKAIVGTEVRNGTSLFNISGGNLTTGNVDVAFKEAKANYDKAKADFDRASELVKDNIVSQKDYLQAKTNFENARTSYNNIARNYSAKGQRVSSPLAGFVKDILVSEGQYVEVGAPLVIISQNKKLLLQANVSQRYFTMLPSISSANFKTMGSESVHNTRELNGKIISYGKSATANSPFIPVTFEIDNAGDIIPGSVVDVYLKTAPIPNALTIPYASLMEEQGQFYVYVQTGGESFQKRQVKVGATDGLHVQVESGVAEGERVVTKGAYQIKLSSASGALPAHGHEH